MRRLRVLTWHVHGNYLWYLSQAQHEFYLPVRANRAGGYGGRGETFPFGNNVHDIPAGAVREQSFDCVLYQSRRHFQIDRFEILSDEQRRLPQICLEHDPPWDQPADELHWSRESASLLVHCTHFNRLMWDNGRTPTRVIEHGVMVPDDARYRGTLRHGLVVVNQLQRRGRKVGADLYEAFREPAALDLVGMESEQSHGLGEIAPPRLPYFMADYRYFFTPIRYTSLGLAILEAMTVGLPIVGLATCELATVIRNGCEGFIATDPAELLHVAQALLDDPRLAADLGGRARQTAQERFPIQRFARDWEQTLWDVAGDTTPRRTVTALTS